MRGSRRSRRDVVIIQPCPDLSPNKERWRRETRESRTPQRESGWTGGATQPKVETKRRPSVEKGFGPRGQASAPRGSLSGRSGRRAPARHPRPGGGHRLRQPFSSTPMSTNVKRAIIQTSTPLPFFMRKGRAALVIG